MKPENDLPGAPTRHNWVPRAAVAAVAVAAIGAAVMVKRVETNTPQVASADRPASASSDGTGVVKAPPLKPAAQRASAARPDTAVMGSASACTNCGVVEMVVAVHEHATPKPSGYQMHIRMDDGSVRTVQQRGAMAAGSRVRVEGSSVRALAPNG